MCGISKSFVPHRKKIPIKLNVRLLRECCHFVYSDAVSDQYNSHINRKVYDVWLFNNCWCMCHSVAKGEGGFSGAVSGCGLCSLLWFARQGSRAGRSRPTLVRKKNPLVPRVPFRKLMPPFSLTVICSWSIYRVESKLCDFSVFTLNPVTKRLRW